MEKENLTNPINPEEENNELKNKTKEKIKFVERMLSIEEARIRNNKPNSSYNHEMIEGTVKKYAPDDEELLLRIELIDYLQSDNPEEIKLILPKCENFKNSNKILINMSYLYGKLYRIEHREEYKEYIEQLSYINRNLKSVNLMTAFYNGAFEESEKYLIEEAFKGIYVSKINSNHIKNLNISDYWVKEILLLLYYDKTKNSKLFIQKIKELKKLYADNEYCVHSLNILQNSYNSKGLPKYDSYFSLFGLDPDFTKPVNSVALGIEEYVAPKRDIETKVIVQEPIVKKEKTQPKIVSVTGSTVNSRNHIKYNNTNKGVARVNNVKKVLTIGEVYQIEVEAIEKYIYASLCDESVNQKKALKAFDIADDLAEKPVTNEKAVALVKSLYKKISK